MLLRYLLTIALFAHGVGHLLFFANFWGYWNGGEEGSSSWLFSGVLGANAPRHLGAGVARPPDKLRCSLLGLPHPPGMVATTGACLRGDLFSDDRPVVG
jgi:hypothetical protein